MEKLEKYYKNWKSIAKILTSIVALFMVLHNLLNSINDLNKTTKTTQQMALKSVIWNEEIPLAERASACDTYLNAGYNSLTKKECEVILKKGEEQGVFSYKEGEVKENDYRNRIWAITSISYRNFGSIY